MAREEGGGGEQSGEEKAAGGDGEQSGDEKASNGGVGDRE